MKLLDTFNVLEEQGIIPANLEFDIKQNLRFKPRPYQVKAINRFNYYLNDYRNKLKPIHS